MAPEAQYPLVPTFSAQADLPSMASNQWRLAHIQQTQRSIMEAELTAMHSGGESLSREKVLNALKGANMVLESLQQSLLPDARLSMSLQAPKSSEGLPIRSGSPEARLTLPSARPFTFSGSLYRTGGHQLLSDGDTPKGVAMSLENPGLVLAVPNVPSQSSLNSPRKSIHSVPEVGFKPFPATFSIPSFNRETVRPVFHSSFLPPSRTPGQPVFGDLSSSDKPPGFHGPQLYPPSVGRGLPTPINAHEIIASERLTSFLREEVAQKGDSGLMRILHGIPKQC